jgi:hypothetical protein
MNQINISFNPIEDRLLLRINAGEKELMDEYLFWLTRRLVKMLFPLLDKLLEADMDLLTQVSGANRKAVIEFQKEEALLKTDFKTPYVANPKNTPFGKLPLLISKVQAAKTPDGKQLLSFITVTDKRISLFINSQLIHSIKKLLSDGIKKAGWDIEQTSVLMAKPEKLI